MRAKIGDDVLLLHFFSLRRANSIIFGVGGREGDLSPQSTLMNTPLETITVNPLLLAPKSRSTTHSCTHTYINM